MPRPRKYNPEIASLAADRERRAAVASRGARVVKATLEPLELQALAEIKQRHGLTTQSEAIAYAIITTARAVAE